MKNSMKGSIDSQIRKQQFNKFIDADNEKRKDFLKERGIILGALYVGRYDKTTKRVRIEYLKNPFTGKPIEALPGKSGFYPEDYPIVIKLLINLKKYLPEDIFVAEMVGGHIDTKQAKEVSELLASLKESEKKINNLEDELRKGKNDKKRYTDLSAVASAAALKDENKKLKRQNTILKGSLESQYAELEEYKAINKKLQSEIQIQERNNEQFKKMLEAESVRIKENRARFEQIEDSIKKQNLELRRKLFEREKIARIIFDRDIKEILHVTRIENLESILRNGIIPIARIGVASVRNDYGRYDKKLDCTSLSVTRMNLRYFSKAAERDEGQTFVCIYIRPTILLDENTKYFCQHNAATGSISDATGQGLLATADDFENMFAETVEYQKIDGKQSLSRSYYHKDNWATSDQAEILYEGIIKPQNFIAVAFPTEKTLAVFKNLLDRNGIKGIVDPKLRF